MKVKHTLIALVTGATVIGCVATAAHATGPLSTASPAAALAASGTQRAATGIQSPAGGLTRSTGGARLSGEAGDDSGRVVVRRSVLGDSTTQRHAIVSGRTPALSRSGLGTDAAGAAQDA